MNKYQNTSGFSHHFLLPVVALLLVGAIGVSTLRLSGATSKVYTLSSCRTKTLAKGSSGGCVKVLQKIINKTRTNDIDSDGAFGSNTKSAVQTFQRSTKYGGAVKDDGIVGKNTWNKLSKVSGASAIRVTVEVKTTTTPAKTSTVPKCTYKRVVFTGINGPKPSDPHCAASTLGERQYKADLKAYKIMVHADELSVSSNGNVSSTKSEPYIASACKGTTIRLVAVTNQWDQLSFGRYMCVSKVLK